jgi:hypothetical protein
MFEKIVKMHDNGLVIYIEKSWVRKCGKDNNGIFLFDDVLFFDYKQYKYLKLCEVFNN